MDQRYPIGTQFTTRGKAPRLCTVTDVLRTYNSRGELVSLRYVATHEFLGQTIADRDVCDATIARGMPYTPPPETPNDREALRLQLERATQLEALASWRERGVL